MGKRVLVTGASGLLGRAILKEFTQCQDEWEALGLAYSRAKGNLKKVDLKNKDDVASIVEEFKPNIVIHSAAERRPDIVEKNEEETKMLNVTATRNIAEASSKADAFFLYISTDYVFDGSNPPYKPTDKPNPLNKYGQSKLEGENVTLEFLPRSGVLRVPILYGPVEYIHESAVTGLFDIIKKGTKTNVSNYEQRYPTSVNDIAVVCRHIAEKCLMDKMFNGIWHWRSNDKLTKYQMIQVLSEISNTPIDHITADNSPSPGAKRPYDCEFDCSDLEAVGIGQRTSFRKGISDSLAPFMI